MQIGVVHCYQGLNLIFLIFAITPIDCSVNILIKIGKIWATKKILVQESRR